MQPDFDFQFGRRGHLRGYGLRGLVALGLVLLAAVIIALPATTTTTIAIGTVWSYLERLF